MSGPADLQPGDPRELREGRYRIEKVLGRGGAAVVFRVWDSTLEVHRAAKVLSKDFKDDQGFRERFLREARTIARLPHPHIVTVHDVGREGERDYIVMEEVTGGTLLDIAGAQTDPARVCRLIREATEALAYAHEAGVVHRDVKPHNILLTADDRAKLTDFGIARADNAERQLTGTGMVLGTWSYMAPEQLEATTPADHRVDIYAMGATLYAVLTQREPHGLYAAEAHATRMRGIPEALAGIIAKATAFSATQRYATARDMVAALGRAERALSAGAGADLGQAVCEHSEDELVDGPSSVTFSFGAQRPELDQDDDSEIIPDELYGPLPSAEGVQPPQPASQRPPLGRAPTTSRRGLGPVREGPKATPRRIERVETRTRVLEKPAHWGGASAPPAPAGSAPKARGAVAQRGVLLAAILMLLAGGALVALLLNEDLVDDVLAGLEAGAPDRTEGQAHRAQGAGVEAPAPSSDLSAAPDEIVVELRSRQGDFHQIKAACPRDSQEHFVARFAGGIARLGGLPSGVTCQVDLEGPQTIVIGEHQPGLALACRPSGRDANCGS